MTGELWRICGLALLCAVATMLLSRLGGDLIGPLRLAGSVLIFGVLILGVGEVLTSLRELFAQSGAWQYADRMIRALGLSLLTAICSDLCRDLGEGTLAGGVELAGKLSIVVLCLPLVEEILTVAAEILSLGNG